MRLIVKRIALLFFAISMFSNIEIAQSAKPEVADSTKTEQDIAASWTHPKPPPTGKVLRVHQEFMANIDLYKDDELQTYVQALGERLVEESEDAGKDYYFFVLDSPGVNAVTPGYGLVYVYRGLLTLMNSEAELAGVLAHEIGHNVGRHRSRTIGEITLGNVGAFVAGILTNSGNVMNSVGLANQERFSENRRDRELEADAYAAEFLYGAEYEPTEFLSALGALKDYSDFQSRFGDQNTSYHGTFSSHPRDDRRLQNVVAKAGALPPGEGAVGREQWRAVSEGMIVGPNYTGNKKPTQERFLNTALGITFVYPKDWDLKSNGQGVLLKDPQNTVQLKITARSITNATKTVREEFDTLYPKPATKSVDLEDENKSVIGVIGADQTRRLALKRIGRYDFQFEGIAKNNALTAEQDKALVDIIMDFRRFSRADLPPEAITRITYQRLEPGETFASLAKALGDDEAGEPMLRLINGYYPRGEAEPGTWIKVFTKTPSGKQ